MTAHQPHPTILLVEDDQLLRDSFEILLGDAGYRVLPAATADRAIELARDERPGLVILDFGLPDRPGLDVARAIRQDPSLAGMPVIGLTGRVGAGQEEAALEAGCDRFLPKPVAPTLLLRELAALMEA